MTRSIIAPYPPPGPPVIFAYPEGRRTKKHACSVCGADGMPYGSWKESHRRGHRRCPDCGRWLTVLLDGSARRHARCPRRWP